MKLQEKGGETYCRVLEKERMDRTKEINDLNVRELWEKLKRRWHARQWEEESLHSKNEWTRGGKDVSKRETKLMCDASRYCKKCVRARVVSIWEKKGGDLNDCVCAIDCVWLRVRMHVSARTLGKRGSGEDTKN